MTGYPMEQDPSDPDAGPPPADPATLAEAIEAARAERDEQGRVVLERARALRECIEAVQAIPSPEEDEHLTVAGYERASQRATASTATTVAFDRFLEADADLAHIERRLARLEAEQGAPPLDDAAYQRARVAGLADRDDVRGVAGTMRRAL